LKTHGNTSAAALMQITQQHRAWNAPARPLVALGRHWIGQNAFSEGYGNQTTRGSKALLSRRIIRQQPRTHTAGMMRGFLRLAEFVHTIPAPCALLF